MNASPPYSPDSQMIADAIISSISDELCIPPEDVASDKTLSELGYEDTTELLSLSHKIEHVLKITINNLRDRVPLLLGENNPNLLRSETVLNIVHRIRGKMTSAIG